VAPTNSVAENQTLNVMIERDPLEIALTRHV
jgi:hypothetical protein